jgi:hypothetical protein
LAETAIPSSKSSQNKMLGLGLDDPGQPGSIALAAWAQTKRIGTIAAQHSEK